MEEVIHFCGRGYTNVVILVSALGPKFGLGLGHGPGLDNFLLQIDHTSEFEDYSLSVTTDYRKKVITKISLIIYGSII